MKRSMLAVCLISVVLFLPLAGGTASARIDAASGQNKATSLEEIAPDVKDVGDPQILQQPAPKDPAEAQMERRRLKEQNRQRQENLKRDTDKLLQLATELKLQVDKSNEHTLSLDVIRKADEIEKLAKSVKDKMRGGNY